jgi:hypothetical protein
MRNSRKTERGGGMIPSELILAVARPALCDLDR